MNRWMVAAIALAVVLVAAVAGLGIYALNLRDDLAALRVHNAEIEAENAQLVDEIDDLRSEVDEMVDDADALRGNRRALRRELAKLRAALEEAAATAVADCGDVVDIGAGVSQVSAQNVDCDTALAVARSWQEECFFARCDPAEPIDGYICRMERAGEEVVDVTCTEPAGSIVRFEAGS